MRRGAKIGIAAPAGVVDAERLAAGCEQLRKLGFEPVHRADVLDRRGYLAGDDARRAAELMELVRDPEIGAIVCARGGYGSARLIGMLDAAVFRAARKPLVGYSDITTLLLWQRRAAGLMGIHGPMLERAESWPADVAHALTRALTGTGGPMRLAGTPVASGWAEGRLVGGSLSVSVASLGTPWEIDTRDAILLIEDITELPYRLDRLLQQLRAAGKLEAAVGIGLGAFTDCDDPRYPEIGLDELIEELLLPLGLPIVRDLPFGHTLHNLAWPYGARAAIDGDRGEVELLESAVAAR